MKDKSVLGVDSSFLIDVERGDMKAIKLLERLKTNSFRTVDSCAFELLTNSPNKQKTLDMLHHLEPFSTNMQAMMFASEIKIFLQTQGSPIGSVDCLIAGTFLAHNVTRVISRDKHFLKIPGLSIISY